MSTDATTTDGFRVGRRVRIVNADCRWNTHEAIIIGKSGGPEIWYAVPEGSDCSRPFRKWEMELLPKPDATPEPAPADDPAKDHYAILRERGFEPWDVMQASFPADWCVAYNVLTALTYLQRCTLKHPTPDDDIRKAHAHLAEAVRILDEGGRPS